MSQSAVIADHSHATVCIRHVGQDFAHATECNFLIIFS
jgi:hypothetical protein